ncbi:unnamed protein product [Fraxinus pennsylvanica]|uniref:Uncharacterized protein n=1 Tax=Fraxinus pennsylvanica TaxID=56036 RepID=A0AAD1ZES3_9LAMI|nr:unnamed protein product [Fraxinus pennsylvanica]
MPTHKHSYATPENVEFGPLLLCHMTAFLAERFPRTLCCCHRHLRPGSAVFITTSHELLSPEPAAFWKPQVDSGYVVGGFGFQGLSILDLGNLGRVRGVIIESVLH